MTMYTPTYRGALTEETDVRLAYDDRYLYIGGRLYDTDPRGIRANTLYRDQYSGDDLLGIVLDTYNDYQTAVSFLVNPAGARIDRAILNDAELTAGFPMNEDWNTYWDVITQRDARGWYVEMRIPFSSLGFQDAGGQVEMGLIAYRLVARKWERHIYPAVPPNWQFGFMKPSQAQRIALDNVYARRPFYVTPYLLGGLDQRAVLDTAIPAYGRADDFTGEAGLDVKYAPTSNLALDVTVNTDFAQVEADDQQINLTRFSLFFPEKRQFFQERSSTFDFSTGGFSRLFHSRQIGLDRGEIGRIYGGARAVGRIGGLDYGVLNMQTAESANLPSENFGVLRLKQQMLNPHSFIGTMGTSRLGADGNYNFAAGLDAVIRPFGDEYVTLKWVQTWDKADPSGSDLLDRSLLIGQWERRNENGFSYVANYARSGTIYNPRLGFVQRRDFQRFANTLQYQWFLPASSPLRTVAIRSDVLGYQRNNDDTWESGAIEPGVRVETKAGHQLTVSGPSLFESVRDSFVISGGAPIPPGEYWFHEGRVIFETSRGAIFRPNITASAGTFYDGWRVGTTLTPAWSLSKHVQLSLDYTFNAIRFPDRNVSLDQHLARLRVQTALDTHLSLNAFVQYNDVDNRMSVNARLRYHFREGRDLWLVYDEGLNTERPLVSGLTLPLSSGRAFRIKYTHTLIW